MYIPGCPPRPEALIDGMLKLKEKIMHPERVELSDPQRKGQVANG